MHRVSPLPFALILAAACAGGPSASVVERYCSTTCAKLTECGLTGGLSEAACKETCSTSTTEPTCDVSQAESDACLDAYESSSCDELRTGSPEECQQTCEGDDSGTQQTDVPDDVTGPTGLCADLQACCDQLDELTASVCQLVVDAGFAAGCGPALDAYVDDGQCTR